MAVLLTGGTGKTATRIAQLLQDAQTPFLLASRRAGAAAPPGMPAVKFDWLDPSTFENPFKYEFTGGGRISAIYLLAPEAPEPWKPLNAFVDFAVQEYAVKRFVLMAGSSSTPEGRGSVGKVWAHLIDIGVEHYVLRPTWFMDNFSEGWHSSSIKKESKIYAACADGKVPFVSVADIAAVAFHVLTDEKPRDLDYRILGPELLTHDEIAAKLSSCLGRTIVNVKLTDTERVQQFVALGVPEHYGKFLVTLEVQAANGVEERMNDVVPQVTGRPGQTFDEFANQHQSSWQ